MPTLAPAAVMESYSPTTFPSFILTTLFLCPSFATKVFLFDGSENLHEYPLAVATVPLQQAWMAESWAQLHEAASVIVENSRTTSPFFTAWTSLPLLFPIGFDRASPWDIHADIRFLSVLALIFPTTAALVRGIRPSDVRTKAVFERLFMFSAGVTHRQFSFE